MARVELNKPAPDFELSDRFGESIRLSDFRGRKNVLLVFNRGFTWPFCRGHMAQLRRDYQEYVDRDVAILVIGPENAGRFNEFFNENQLPFTGLPDPKHSVLKRYGQEVNLFKLGRMPAQVLVDKQGIARFVHYGNSMADFPDNDALLKLVDSLDSLTDPANLDT